MPNLRELTPPVVARVRSGVVSALVCAATDLDENLRSSLPAGSYSVVLAGPRGIRRKVAFSDGRARENCQGPGSLVLRFTSAQGMAETLGGGKGGILPLPTSPKFLKALQAFVKTSSYVGEASSRREFSDQGSKRLSTELLMTAAFRGVAETAAADEWTAGKSSRMPNGIVEVLIEGSDISGWLSCEQRSGRKVWSSGRGASPAAVNARLSIADTDTAFDVFTGSLPALNALGRGRVSIGGQIPMIRTVFPLLDRFGEIMNWRA